jgi:transcription elongation factor S-II
MTPSLRQKVVDYYVKRLNSLGGSETAAAAAAANIEIGIYNYAIREATAKKIVKSWENKYFAQLYKNRLRSIYFNVDDARLEAIARGQVQARDLAFMTHQELCPEKWADLIEKKHIRESNQATVRQCTTDLFICKKCGSKNCTYYELQIRSADEPATIFVSCLDCGKNWRC